MTQLPEEQQRLAIPPEPPLPSPDEVRWAWRETLRFGVAETAAAVGTTPERLREVFARYLATRNRR